MKYSYFLLSFLLLALSCGKIEYSISEPFDKSVVIPLKLVAEPLEDKAKSSIDNLALIQIDNVNYYLFQDGSLKGQRYFSDAASVELTLPDADGQYELYLLANCGETVIPSSTKENEMGTAVHVDFGSRAAYLESIARGVPMYGTVQGFTVNSSTRFSLKRLVHRIELSMDTSLLEKTNITFTSIRVKQAARDIFPFAAKSKATQCVDADEATEEDLLRINSGGSVSLYVLENMRGNLISATSWKDKVPSRIASSEERSLATYLEIGARVQTPTATYSETTYRTYLGLSPSNFDSPRNGCFSLRSVFTSEVVEDEDWRIEGGSPQITGDLRFVSTASSLEDVEDFYLMKGFCAVYYVYRSNPDIDFTISADIPSSLSPYLSWKTARVDDNYTAVLFRTELSPNTNAHYNYDGSDSDDTANVTIQVRSSDGLIGDSIRCKVLKKALGMKFYYTTAGDLRTQIFHPEALAFYVHVSGSVLGSVTYKPSGTWFASETRETTVIISNARSEASASTRVQPLGRLARIDNYRYLNGYERTSEGFAEYFQEVWNLTGWDSYTALNGSNGYYKHAHPTALYLNIVLSFTSLDPLHFYPEEGARIPVYYDHVLPRVVYPGTTSEYVAGAGTDWLFLWRQYDREGGDYMDMVFNLSTYIVGSSGFEHGRLYEEGSDRVPIHINVNGVDNTHDYQLPLSGRFQSIDFYADASNWK
ncbi:MAG: DUF4906 domain-containing protein [Bacteroidales bacterium]|nr:DUF4906 domain-containing protein [Bacteroidales bacterium]